MYTFQKIAVVCMITGLFLCSCTETNNDKGALCLRLGDYNLASRFFEKELEKNPASFDARLGLGKALLQEAADRHGDSTLWRMALINLEAATTLRPEVGLGPLLCDAWYQRARMLLFAGDTLSGLSAVSRAIEHNPRAIDPINLAGIVYFRLGNTAQAEALFLKVLSIDSLHASARFNAGMACWFREDAAGAHRHWLEALKSNPKDQDIIYWFALAEKTVREKGK